MYIYVFKNIIQYQYNEEYSDLIDKIIKYDNFPWLHILESFNTESLNKLNLKCILAKYYYVFNDFDKIYRCALFWDMQFYTSVFECLYEINAGSIKYVNINNINENSKLIKIKNSYRSSYYDDYTKNSSENIYTHPIDDIKFYDGGFYEDGYMIICANNLKFIFSCNVHFCEAGIRLRDKYEDVSVLIGKIIINITVDNEGSVQRDMECVDTDVYTILFNDYSIFKFNMVSVSNGYYEGILTIELCDTNM